MVLNKQKTSVNNYMHGIATYKVMLHLLLIMGELTQVNLQPEMPDIIAHL